MLYRHVIMYKYFGIKLSCNYKYFFCDR